jgi:hypothetical protein
VFLLEISHMKFSFSIMTLLLTFVSLQGGNAHAEMRLAIAISNSDGTTTPKTPNSANGGTAIAAVISGGDPSSCAG